MEIFCAEEVSGDICRLGEDESAHCVRVLRHRAGDLISVIDGLGTMFECTLTEASPKGAVARVERQFPGWGGHRYELTMAVCPTKNIDRYEWFAEKATEFGIDRIVPVIGERSERKVLKPERLNRILLSATKQSLKSKIPELAEVMSVNDFVRGADDGDALKLIAYCFEDGERRHSIREVLEGYSGHKVIVLIGPEGDFSREEAEAAIDSGFVPVHIGESRLRTETAALAAVSMTYYKYL